MKKLQTTNYKPQTSERIILLRDNSGFTLLLASLIASLLLSVGLSMFTIAQKEIILSSLGRDSQYAFYAADAGAECALYWDFKNSFNPDVATHNATCNGQAIGTYELGVAPPSATPEDLVLGGKGYQAGVATTNFWFQQSVASGTGGGVRKRCVNVTVVKREGRNPATEINSRGYSTGCDADGNPIINSRTLERAVRMRY